MTSQHLNSISKFLVKSFEEEQKVEYSKSGMRVNQVVSEIASWYERLRNAMEYREDEVILRATIERILKRRLILGGSGKTVADPMIRELIWARYFPDGSIPESIVEECRKTIDLYLALKEEISLKHKIKGDDINEFMYQVLSSHLEHILNPDKDKETMINYMFHILKNNITIVDDTEETRDVQVFIAIRRSYAKNDLAFLRYHLFVQFFGKLTDTTIETIATNFKDGYKQIQRQLTYPLRFKIFSYIKKQTPPFLILDDILTKEKEKAEEILSNPDRLSEVVTEAAKKRYKNITSKVRRAIIRSVFFILLTKVAFAFAIEGTYERYFYGGIQWGTLSLNVIVPPLLMIIVGLLIRTPDKKNTQRILQRIKTLLYDPKPIVGSPISVYHIRKKTVSFLEASLTFMWIVAFITSFGLVAYILSRFHFTLISQGVFLFFLAIVAFLAYRINRTAHLYTVGDKQNFITPLIDFLFLPIAQVGRYLTEGISQINIILFIFDFIIETPFKGLFRFFEQLFFFLHTKRDYLE